VTSTCARSSTSRDLGGYLTADGSHPTRWRRLLRGAGLHRLAGDDRYAVAALGLRTVIDLRTVGERETAGYAPAAGTAVHHLR
jgi:protein-tyrosine phosphatase